MKKDACENTCEELGRAAREEAERVQKIYTAGYEIRAQLIAKGKELRLQKQVLYSLKNMFDFVFMYVI